ncbi:Glycosyltransferase AglD [uncultured archaeon]|nr:Glycosyltransferase AglD [uncultured archaeon]
MEKIKVCIIIPAYNEEKRIGATLEEYGNFYSKIKKESIEILVVINNTRDKTEEVVKKYQKKFENIRFLNFKQGGKGFAITEGFRYALEKKFDLMGFVDADCATPPNAFYDLITNIQEYDGIIANRWDKRSKLPIKQPFLRRFISRIFNFMVRCLFFLNFRDTQCGAKLFKRKAIEKVFGDLKVSAWVFDVNILYAMKKKSLKVRDFPTYWIDKEGSTVYPLKTSFNMFLGIIRLRMINSPLDKFSKPLKPLIRKVWGSLK